ncbi:MAG: four helix bundle protein [Bacteroidota bacterium]|nr:four helix bundle protein [Bacteroidota bacterium]
MRPHKQLVAWKEAIELVKLIYKLTKLFPEDEKFGIISQLRRASVSVPANIAEGAARASSKEYSHFINIALGSLSEIDTLLTISFELAYLQEIDFNKAIQQSDKVTALSSGLYKSILNSLKS